MASISASASSFERRPAAPVAPPCPGQRLKEHVRKISGHRYARFRIRYWLRAGRSAWVLEETGKERPITCGFAVSSSGIEELKVLIFRESRGWEIRMMSVNRPVFFGDFPVRGRGYVLALTPAPLPRGEGLLLSPLSRGERGCYCRPSPDMHGLDCNANTSYSHLHKLYCKGGSMQPKPTKWYSRTLFAAVCLLALAVAAPSVALAASDREFRELQRTVQELKRQLDQAEQKIEEMSRDVSGNAQAVEAAAMAIEEADSKPSVFDNMSMGGYGELHYNNHDVDDSERADDLDRIDFHRFVLFFGYDWSDNLRFFSELEVEHALAGEGQPGEVELEQAYVEYDFDAHNTARAGVFLLPIGIMNETHEPPTFYGVERNVVENVIIPATWWAGGVGFTHRADNGLQLDLALHEGLKLVPGSRNQTRIRSGRQKTANADADDLAFTGRLKYTGMPGLELGAAIQYQSDLAQGVTEAPDADIEDAWLYEAHVALNRGPFGLRALYAQWDIDADGAAEEYDDQKGWYVEPSFRLSESFGVFARYADVEGGRARDEFDQWTLGFNYWLNEDAVLKADYQKRDHDDDVTNGWSDFDGFNLGVGYQF